VPLLEELSFVIYSLDIVPQEVKIYPNEKIYSALAVEHKFTYGQLYLFEYTVKVKKDWCAENKFTSNDIKIFGMIDTDRVYGEIISTAEDENYYYYTVTFDKFTHNLVVVGAGQQN
jgi:hypothetical protein